MTGRFSKYTGIIALVLALFLTAGCGKKEAQITSLEMLKGGKTFAVPTGTVADQFVLKKFPDAKIEYYNTVLDCILAVRDGKADAASYDKPIVQNIVAKNDGLLVIPELMFEDQYGFAVRLEEPGLKKTIDEVLAELKSNGTYKQMEQRWFPEKGAPAPMPVIRFRDTDSVFRFGTAAVTEPMSYYDANKQIVGFDIEFAAYVARKLGKRLEIVDMEFGAMLPALVAGKVDMIGAGMSITPERAKKVLFSECYYQSGIAAVVKDHRVNADAKPGKKLRNLKDISNKRIGVLMGSVHDAYATKNFPKAEILQYQSISDLLFALNSSKIDVGFIDKSAVTHVLKTNEDLGVFIDSVFSVPIGAGFNKESTQLREQFNEYLKKIKGDGTYAGMIDRWMVKGLSEMPELDYKPVNGPLNVGIVSDLGLPSIAVQNGELVGFDIEVAQRFAAAIGREFVPVDLQFGSLIASISTKKIDMITSSMMITEERKKRIDFSDPYFESAVTILAKKSNLPAGTDASGSPKGKSFWQKVASSFYSNIIFEKRYLHIIDGLKVTVLISILATLLGTIIGAVVCFMRMSKSRFLSSPAKFYISLVRGIPVLVLLMVIYYVVFASVNINPVVVSVIAFGLNFGAYVSEMFRTGIESIDRGQKEAAIAGGFTKFQAFRFIILPQAIRHIMPVYKGEFISLIKMTSVVGYIAVQDLTKASDIIRSRTFDAFLPIIMVAVLYFLIAWLLTKGLDLIEISSDPRRRARNRQGRGQS